jgi:uncharacterized protein (TIGR02145 family)
MHYAGCLRKKFGEPRTYTFTISTINEGTSNGDIIFNPNLTYGSVQDIDGITYKTIQIGTQTWMAENLKTTRYNNGDLIGTTTPATLDIFNETEPKYLWAPNGNESNVPIYGRLYTWYTIMERRKICPVRWHIPSDSEWTSLTSYLYLTGDPVIGFKLKEPGSMHWSSSNSSSTNETGFTAFPGGVRLSFGLLFVQIGDVGYWWSSSENLSRQTDAWYISMEVLNPSWVSRATTFKKDGLSVHCLKD